MPPQWSSRFKNEDGTITDKKLVILNFSEKADKAGKFYLEKINGSVSVPINKKAEVTTTRELLPVPYIRVEVSRPSLVLYILDNNRVIKAEDPASTTFEGEYYGN